MHATSTSTSSTSMAREYLGLSPAAPSLDEMQMTGTVLDRFWNLCTEKILHNLYRIRTGKASGWFGMELENCCRGSRGDTECNNKIHKIDEH